MNHTSFLISALNDLKKINDNRIVGYMQVAKEMDDTDVFLKEMCIEIIREGKNNIKELAYQIKKINSESSFLNNKSYKTINLWKELGKADYYDDAELSFATCVCSEDAVQKVYEDILLTYTFMPIELRAMITQQKKKIGYAKKLIMNYFNSNKIVAIA